MSPDRAWLVETLQALVRIDSRNPSLVSGAPGEGEIAGFVASTLEALALEVAIHEPEPGRPSVVGRLPGRGGGRSLLLNAHYDTVGVEGMEDPFSADVRDGRLYGRGAYDMKGSLAACLAVARTLAEGKTPLAGDLLIAAVADEEYASLGTADLIERYPVDGAIVTEPTALEICVAHRGFAWLEVRTRGRAAHGSDYANGVDANLRMGRLLAKLDALEKELRARPGHALLGPPSLHAATLRGGSGLSTYAAECTLRIERRTIPGETEETARAEIEALLDELRGDDPDYEASLRVTFGRPPFETAPDAPVVRSLRGAATALLGGEPPFVGRSPWMDSALLAAAGVDTVVFGPAGAGAHSAVEWVDLESVEKLAEILAATAADYCR